jgi:hypothetical protein
VTFICYAGTVFRIISINKARFPIVIRQAFKIIKTSCCLIYYFIANLKSHWDSLGYFFDKFILGHCPIYMASYHFIHFMNLWRQHKAAPIPQSI